MRRIVVVGTTGSGKTTLAAVLAGWLGVRHVELDALYWGPAWTPRADDTFRASVEEATAGDCWVADGNYSRVRDVLWSRADTVIWLDYPLPLIMWRLLWRTLRRVARSQALWNGNRERFAGQFLARDSLFVWALTTHHQRRRDYLKADTWSAYPQSRVVRLRSPRAARAWLQSIGAASVGEHR